MSEHSIVSARAAVYYYDQTGKSWKNVDTGLSRVDIYFNPSASTWRVIALDAKNPQTVTINSPIFKELQYQKSIRNISSMV